jgi:WD40 repeat protein
MMVANSTNQVNKKSRMKLSILGILILLSLSLWSQTSNSDFERIKLATDENEFSGIALSPDNNTIAISTKKSSTVKIMDWTNRKVRQEINAGNWNLGSKISYSDGGKYLLQQEISYMDFNQNSDRSIDFEIIDAATGKQIKRFEKVQDVVISSDEKYAVCLSNDEANFWNLINGAKEKSISIPGASKAIALSPDGKTLAVSKTINPIDLKSRFKKDKKGLKNAAKYKQMISLFDVQASAKIKTVDELYDVIYNLGFSPDGAILFVFQTPDIRNQVNNNKQTFINLIDVAKQEPLRKGFTSMSVNQPELKISNDQKWFAISSKGTRFQEIHLYDSETGTLQKRFELGSRLFEKVDGIKLTSDSRPSFTFLPDDQSILIAMGNQLVVWNVELNSLEQ